MSNTAAPACTPPAAQRAGMPKPSQPICELKIAIGCGLTLACHYCAPIAGHLGPYVRLAITHSQLRHGRFKLPTVASIVLRTQEIERAVLDDDVLWVDSASIELGSRANGEAIRNWLAAHGLALRLEET